MDFDANFLKSNFQMVSLSVNPEMTGLRCLPGNVVTTGVKEHSSVTVS